MRTTPEALLALQKDGAEPPQFTNYACHVKGMDRAINIRIPFYSLENMPKMTEQEHAQLLERNRQRTAYAPAAPPATPQSAEMPAPPLSAEHHPKSYAADSDRGFQHPSPLLPQTIFTPAITPNRRLSGVIHNFSSAHRAKSLYIPTHSAPPLPSTHIMFGAIALPWMRQSTKNVALHVGHVTQ